MLFYVLAITSSSTVNLTASVNEMANEAASKSLVVIDWSQFVPAIISTFLGFALALIGQWGWEYYKDCNNAKQLIKQLASELIRIKNELEIISGISVEPFKLPIWNICISTGNLKLLNSEMQAELSHVYSIIKEFNSWSLMQANYYFENNRLSEVLEKELERLKNILLGNDERSINNLLRMLKGGN